MAFQPTIGPEIFTMRPDFAALSIHATNAYNPPFDDTTYQQLKNACQEPNAAVWAEEHLEAWREAYRSFGAKPQRTPCSAEALHKRVQRDRSLSSVNAVVDLYNALSIRYALPIGGEDAAQYEGRPALVRAKGGEPFDTISDGAPKIEGVDQGEVVWRDARGVTCRRWNWRQGVRTRITEQTTEMWFVLERLGPMPIDALLEAGDELVKGLRQLSPQVRTSQILIKADTVPN